MTTHAARQKVQRYRARLRAAGLKPVQIWIPDAASPRIREEARRQSLLASSAADEAAALADIDALTAEHWGTGGTSPR